MAMFSVVRLVTVTAIVASMAFGVLTSAPAFAQLFEATMFDSDLLKGIRDGDDLAVEAALIGGESPNDRSGTGAPAILAAVEYRNLAALNMLIEAGADLDRRNRRNDRTALTFAAQTGEANLVRALLEHGADIERRGEGSEPALIKAARSGHADVIEVLIEFEADLYASDLTGLTALDIAERSRHRAATQLLRDAGAP